MFCDNKHHHADSSHLASLLAIINILHADHVQAHVANILELHGSKLSKSVKDGSGPWLLMHCFN